MEEAITKVDLTGKRFTCNICDKHFQTRTKLNVHYLVHREIRPFICSKCDVAFYEKSKLRRHERLHSSKKLLVCTDCGKCFKHENSLKTHIALHRGIKPYVCKKCSAAFNNSSNLSKHILSHTSEKIHMCDQCGKRFKLKYALKVHWRCHFRIRPFTCDVCRKTFQYNRDLKRHSVIHTDIKIFKCSICETKFRRKDNLDRHLRNSHPGKQAGAIICEQILASSYIGKKTFRDIPNSVNVITSLQSVKSFNSEASMINSSHQPSTSRRTINGPFKLAFKTSAFRNNYNIHRNVETDHSLKLYDMAHSVDICQKILSPQVSDKLCDCATLPTKGNQCKNCNFPIVENIKFKLPGKYL